MIGSRRTLLAAAAALTLVIILVWGAAAPLGNSEGVAPVPPSRFDGLTMGTSYSVQFVAAFTAEQQQALEEEVGELLFALDKEVFSTYAQDSELSRLNRSADLGPTPVSPELFSVLEESLRVAELSGGAFDITLAPVVDLWGFGPGKLALQRQRPPQEQLDQALSSVGYGAIKLNSANGTVEKERPLTLDLSAIAKGYGVDRLAELLESKGISDYFVEIGGELRISGHKDARQQGWVPAIEAPVDGPSQVYEVFRSRGESIAIAGSGDYRNYFESEGVRYSHEIDPRSGLPISHALAAVYVIDESAMTADALATSYMVLGPTAALELAEATGQAAYFIVRDEAAQQLKFTSFSTLAFADFLQ